MAKPVPVSQHPCIVWEIENIFSSNSIESDIFYLGESQWKLELCKNRECGRDYISILIVKINRGILISHDIKITLLFEANNVTSICDINKFTVSGNSSQEIWRKSVSDILKQSDTLGRKFSFLFTSVKILPKEKATCLEQLSIDFGKLLNDKSSDVILECGDQCIRAHKHVLTARSDVFAAMFRAGMKESEDGGVVPVKNMTPEVLDKLIRYIYSGKVGEMTLETTCQLYEAADRYAIVSLKNYCSAIMTKNLSETVACDFLLLAEAHSDEELKNSVIAYIAEWSYIVDTDEWNKFSEEHPALAMKIYKKLLMDD